VSYERQKIHTEFEPYGMKGRGHFEGGIDGRIVSTWILRI
jgi:hypothetical protein